MNVIFLDIDGVLNSCSYREAVSSYYDSPIDENRLPLLKKLIDETDSVTVLTSTWRMYWGKNCDEGRMLDEIFGKYGISIYSKTECFNEERDYEILIWLAKNNVDSYVIIDDLDFGWSENNRRHFVQTDDEKGLTEKDIEKAEKILKER